MTRREVDPLAPLKPVARLAAVGLVAVVGMLAAVQLHDTHAPYPLDAASTGTAGISPAGASFDKPLSPAELLTAVQAPQGSVALHAEPANAPDHGQAPFASDAPVEKGGAAWWSTNLSPAAALAWFRAHPPTGMTLRMWGSTSAGGFLGFAPQRAIDGVRGATVYVETFPMADGRTGVQASADIVYQQVRTAQEMVPLAAKLVVDPRMPASGGQPHGKSVVITDPARIASATKIVNALVITVPTISCPIDNGSGIQMTFESADGAVLAVAGLSAEGCGNASLTVGSTRVPELGGGAAAIPQIQSLVGTHWKLGFQGPR